MNACEWFDTPGQQDKYGHVNTWTVAMFRTLLQFAEEYAEMKLIERTRKEQDDRAANALHKSAAFMG